MSDEISTSDNDTKKFGEIEKNKGNKLFSEHKYHEAMKHYEEAIRIYPNCAVYHANHSLCQIRLEHYGFAIADANEAIRIDKKYSKAYYRRGISYLALENYTSAIQDFKKVLELVPNESYAIKKLKEAEIAYKQSLLADSVSNPDPDTNISIQDIPMNKKGDNLGVSVSSRNKNKTKHSKKQEKAENQDNPIDKEQVPSTRSNIKLFNWTKIIYKYQKTLIHPKQSWYTESQLSQGVHALLTRLSNLKSPGIVISHIEKSLSLTSHNSNNIDNTTNHLSQLNLNDQFFYKKCKKSITDILSSEKFLQTIQSMNIHHIVFIGSFCGYLPMILPTLGIPRSHDMMTLQKITNVEDHSFSSQLTMGIIRKNLLIRLHNSKILDHTSSSQTKNEKKQENIRLENFNRILNCYDVINSFEQNTLKAECFVFTKFDHTVFGGGYLQFLQKIKNNKSNSLPIMIPSNIKIYAQLIHIPLPLHYKLNQLFWSALPSTIDRYRFYTLSNTVLLNFDFTSNMLIGSSIDINFLIDTPQFNTCPYYYENNDTSDTNPFYSNSNIIDGIIYWYELYYHDICYYTNYDLPAVQYIDNEKLDFKGENKSETNKQFSCSCTLGPSCLFFNIPPKIGPNNHTRLPIAYLYNLQTTLSLIRSYYKKSLITLLANQINISENNSMNIITLGTGMSFFSALYLLNQKSKDCFFNLHVLEPHNILASVLRSVIKNINKKLKKKATKHSSIKIYSSETDLLANTTLYKNIDYIIIDQISTGSSLNALLTVLGRIREKCLKEEQIIIETKDDNKKKVFPTRCIPQKIHLYAQIAEDRLSKGKEDIDLTLLNAYRPDPEPEPVYVENTCSGVFHHNSNNINSKISDDTSSTKTINNSDYTMNLKPLSDPFILMDIDLNKSNSDTIQSYKDQEYSIKISTKGVVSAIVTWIEDDYDSPNVIGNLTSVREIFVQHLPEYHIEKNSFLRFEMITSKDSTGFGLKYKLFEDQNKKLDSKLKNECINIIGNPVGTPRIDPRWLQLFTQTRQQFSNTFSRVLSNNQEMIVLTDALLRIGCHPSEFNVFVNVVCSMLNTIYSVS